MVILDIVLPRGFAYDFLSYIYKGAAPAVGARVEVPLGKTKTAVGVVRGVRAADDTKGLKEAIEVWDRMPMVPPRTVELIEFLAHYYMCPAGEVLRALVPGALWRRDFAPKEALYKNRFKRKPRVYGEAPTVEFEVDRSRSAALVHGRLDFDERIRLAAGLHAAGGGQTLVLVPTEAEARAWAGALKAYGPTEVYHAGLSVKSRADLWVRLACSDEPRIVAATRAGVALPFGNLKQVIVWDESSHRYKSGNAPYYSARDAALVLAARWGAHAALVSDVPSVETYFNARSNAAWQYINRPNGLAPLRWIAPEHGRDLQSKYLMRRVGEELAAGRRAVVFQNRRGWSSAWVCTACGEAVECPWCRTPATLHRSTHTMRCRTCGYRFDEPDGCTSCGAVGAFEARGYGTERIADGLVERFAEASVARMDSDSDEGAASAQIVVGTQRLLDEAVDWAGVGVVGVANADNIEVGADFRSSEEAFRTLARLAMRAREAGAEWVLQTRRHDRPLFGWAAGDHEGFYRAELLHRRTALYPPFARLVEFDLRGVEVRALTGVAVGLEERLRMVFGDRLSPLYQPTSEVVGGRHVVKLLLKIEKGRSAQEAKGRILGILQKTKIPNSIALEVIVDPK